MRPLGRLGYNDYVVVNEVFTMPRLNREQLEERGFLEPGVAHEAAGSV
jgi:hypothetical protein